jgi:hypothetical protein
MTLTEQQREIVQKARGLISDKKHWTHGSYAATRSGKPCHTAHPDVYKFCAEGAICLAALRAVKGRMAKGMHMGHAVVIALNSVSSGTPMTVICINDANGHQAVLELFDKALAQ